MGLRSFLRDWLGVPDELNLPAPEPEPKLDEKWFAEATPVRPEPTTGLVPNTEQRAAIAATPRQTSDAWTAAQALIDRGEAVRVTGKAPRPIYEKGKFDKKPRKTDPTIVDPTNASALLASLKG